jgi:hypothetical protein
VRFEEPAFRRKYFQALFLPVQPTHSILNSRRLAARIFGTRAAPYMPHLSLLYGQLLIREKRRIIETLHRTVRRPFTVDAVHLLRADSRRPAGWIEIAEFDLPPSTAAGAAQSPGRAGI